MSRTSRSCSQRHPTRNRVPHYGNSVVSTDRRRLARSLIRVYKHRGAIREPVIEARLAQILITGQEIDFAWRLREHGRLTPELARHYAERVGIAAVHLRSVVLPAMAACDMVDFRYDDSELVNIDEYVGVGATVAEQCYALLEEPVQHRSKRQCFTVSISDRSCRCLPINTAVNRYGADSPTNTQPTR